MDVLLQLELNEEEERGFKDLILLCNQEDKTNYDTALDYDFFYSIRNEEKKESGLKEDYLAILMGYKLGEQEEGKDILLCTVFIHPFMRGQGCLAKVFTMTFGRREFVLLGRPKKSPFFIFLTSILNIFWKKRWSILLFFRERERVILLERYFFLLTMKKHFTFTGLW